MEYKIISGRTVETKRSWFPSGPSYRKPRGTRRAGASSEKKIKANEKSCTMNLARTINCNFEAGDCLFTAKYDDPHYPTADPSLPKEERAEEEYRAAKQILGKKFLPKLRKEYEKQTGKKLKAIWITANWSPHRCSPARLHHHMVLPADAVELARKLWIRLGGIGTVQTRDLNNEGDYTNLASYLMENVKGRPAGENRWSACRGMEKPIYTEPVEVLNVEGVQPEQGGIIKESYNTHDEDGRVISSYIRSTLPQRPKVRGGQIVLPRKPGRRRTE